MRRSGALIYHAERSAAGEWPVDRVSRITAMSQTHSGAKNPHRNGSIGAQSVPEQPWSHDWSNFDPDREPGDGVPDSILRRRKMWLLAHRRGVSTHEADMLLRHDDSVEIADAEVA